MLEAYGTLLSGLARQVWKSSFGRLRGLDLRPIFLDAKDRVRFEVGRGCARREKDTTIRSQCIPPSFDFRVGRNIREQSHGSDDSFDSAGACSRERSFKLFPLQIE